MRGGRLGLSRNKVAVGEPAARSPPTYISGGGPDFSWARSSAVERRLCKPKVPGSSPGGSTRMQRGERERSSREGLRLKRADEARHRSGSRRAGNQATWGMARLERRRRSWQAAKSPGEAQAALEPGMTEWESRRGVDPLRSRLLRGLRTGTPGSETSQYREEEKARAMPSVTASEEGTGQTEPGGESRRGCGVAGPPPIPRTGTRSRLERRAGEGESPVGATVQDTRGGILSRAPRDWRPKPGGTNSQP